MEEEDQKELQLLPIPHPIASSSNYIHRSMVPSDQFDQEAMPPSLDLQLTISVRSDTRSCVEALKWQAAEQIRLAAIEKAYAERVRELTKREMELAQLEFTRAKQLWERVKEEVEKAERLKERAATTRSQCSEMITCQSCSQRFRPLN